MLEGRDVLSRLMYGARLSLLVGCNVWWSSCKRVGIILGTVAGYFGGLVGMHHARGRYYAGPAEGACCWRWCWWRSSASIGILRWR